MIIIIIIIIIIIGARNVACCTDYSLNRGSTVAVFFHELVIFI